MSDPLFKILDTGVRVLSRREWQERERLVYQRLRGMSIQSDARGGLVLPHLSGKTLATLLQDPTLQESIRERAIELAVVALAEFHAQGFTHGDAMAENVMVDLEAGVAHWFDFENTHDARRSMAWRRADDVRALLATCLLRTKRHDVAGTLKLILDIYADNGVARLLATSFSAVFRRPLAFYLGQAALSFQNYHGIGNLLTRRIAAESSSAAFRM